MKIPSNNALPNKIGRIEKIASYIKYMEELIEFIELFSDMAVNWELRSEGKIRVMDEAYEKYKLNIKKISRLKTILLFNRAEVSGSVIDKLYDFICSVEEDRSKENQLNKYQHNYELKVLQNSIYKLGIVENFYAGLENDTVY